MSVSYRIVQLFRQNILLSLFLQHLHKCLSSITPNIKRLAQKLEDLQVGKAMGKLFLEEFRVFLDVFYIC